MNRSLQDDKGKRETPYVQDDNRKNGTTMGCGTPGSAFSTFFKEEKK